MSTIPALGERLYPDMVPPFAHEPLRADFEIRPAGETRGQGLVALRAFAAGDIVFAFTGEILPDVTQFTLQIDANRHIHDPYVMGKVLHHCAPNCHVDMEKLTFVATMPIAAGDYVTMDYCQTEDVLFKPFTCHCGAPACRGYISGRAGAGALLVRPALNDVVDEARRRLAALTPTGSRYGDLVQAARICQEIGNLLSSQIYAGSTKGSGPALACKFGCGTCCHIPFTVPQVTTTDYTMTLVDVIALLEHSGETIFKAAHPRDADGARAVLPVVPCPHLTHEGACGIYSYRPVTCKIWFSADLDLCIRNREDGYRLGVNPRTDESDRLRSAFEEPFAAHVAAIAPGLDFRGHDFLSVFDMVAALAGGSRIDVFRGNIDAGLPITEAYRRALGAFSGEMEIGSPSKMRPNQESGA